MDHHTLRPKRKKSLVEAYFHRVHTLKPSDAFLLKAALLSCAVFAALLLITASVRTTVEIATTGGTYAEGVVGTPRFVNPVLAITRADKDLTTLVYDGLMGLDTEGNLVPNIAESITVSEDGLTYNVILRQSVQFHDGTPLTAHDVAFTFNRIQDPLLASPLRGNLDGVQIEEVGEYELNFILPEAYAPFVENLTFGILPEHIWKDAGSEEFPFSQHNSEPIGSGPYKVKEIVHNASGIPEMYTLEAFKEYHKGRPKIDRIKMYFFPTEERLQSAFKSGLIEGVVGIDPSRLSMYDMKTETHHLERIPLPRTFAVFFNHNKAPVLRDLAARRALNEAIDRQALVEQVLNGYAQPLYSPIPPGFGIEYTSTSTQPTGNIDTARSILTRGGWEFDLETQRWEKEIDGNTASLAFSIATVNNSAFEATAEFLRAAWEKIGVPVSVKQFEQADLTQAVIRPRDYEALLFGTQLGRPLDYYSFWHSSQRNDPGLNVALYANITTDSTLSELRRSTDPEVQKEAIRKFAEEIDKETPALFLYAPELTYLFPNHIKNARFIKVGELHERFMNVHEWYIETDAVWPFLSNTDN